MWNLRRADGTIATGWYLLPLRLFLGITFLVAGVQKLANPSFFRASNPTGIHAQLAQAHLSSPIGGFVGHLEGSSTLVGVLIAIGEVAIGLGTTFGLWTRVAAAAGMLLSFGLFLTVSYHSSPYYTGSDIVFLFAWTPLVLAGAAEAPALDTWLAREGARGSVTDRPGTLTRGALLGGAVVATAAVSGVAAGAGRVAGGTDQTAAPASTTTTTPSSTTSTTTSSSGPPTTAPHGKQIASAGQVPVGSAALFNDPKTGDPSLLLHPSTETYLAFDAICPHQGCTVGYAPSADLIVCPCHGSEFNPKTGAVVSGPAPTGLTRVRVTEGPTGDVYLA